MEIEYGTLEDKTIISRVQQGWTSWRLQEWKYPDMATWWKKYLKRKIRFRFIQEWIAWTREDIINEHFYYACIYGILKDRRHPREKTPTLNQLKAKIVLLYSKCIESIIIDPHAAAFFSGGKPFPFPSSTNAKMAESRMISGVADNHGVTQTNTMGILQTIVVFMRSKYNPILVHGACVNLVGKVVHKS